MNITNVMTDMFVMFILPTIIVVVVMSVMQLRVIGLTYLVLARTLILSVPPQISHIKAYVSLSARLDMRDKRLSVRETLFGCALYILSAPAMIGQYKSRDPFDIRSGQLFCELYIRTCVHYNYIINLVCAKFIFCAR